MSKFGYASSSFVGDAVSPPRGSIFFNKRSTLTLRDAHPVVRVTTSFVTVELVSRKRYDTSIISLLTWVCYCSSSSSACAVKINKVIYKRQMIPIYYR
jgi:hypothetical protein